MSARPRTMPVGGATKGRSPSTGQRPAGARVGSAGEALLRFEVHVRPGSAAPAVGGLHDGALVVRVVQAATQGKANDEALVQVADALGLSRRSVALAKGATSRRKVLEISVAVDQLDEVKHRVEELRARSAKSHP